MPKSLPIFLVLVLLFGSGSADGQSYEWAAGLQLSKFMGISAVYSPKEKYSFEAVLSKNMWTGESGVSLIGRHHKKIITRGLNFYGGGGLHYGMFDDGERGNFGGLLLQGGAEMSLGKTNLSFNITPLVGVGNQDVKFRIGSDVTVRYILKKQERERGKFLRKLGIGKNKDDRNKKNSKRGKNSRNKKENSKADRTYSRDKDGEKGRFWDFEWLKKKD